MDDLEGPSKERLSFNAGWSFTKQDDPLDAEGNLAYAKIKD